MIVKRQTIEFYLIVLGLAFPFFYFVFRSMIWDTFVWIAIIPIAGYLYALSIRTQGLRFLNYSFNGLDQIFLWYLIYGIAMTFIGVVVVGYDFRLGITPFIHYYLPTILYFVARSYTRYSEANVFNLAKMMWVLAIILIVDVFIEYYFVEIKESPLSIPWVKFEVDKIPNITPEVWYELSFDRVLSILSGRKITGMVAISLFAFIIPFFYMQRNKLRQTNWPRSLVFNPVFNAIILASLLVCAFIALNKTAIMAGILVTVIGLLFTRSFKLLGLMTLIGVVGGFLFRDSLWELIQLNFIWKFEFGDTESPRTIFQHVIALDRIISGYSNIEFLRLLLGSYASPSEIQPNFFITTFTTELRALLYPSIFGIGWAVILSLGLITMFRYSLTLINTGYLQFFGLAFLGLLVIFATDLHYPSFIIHGPLEMFFVAAGALSSLRESALQYRRKRVNSTSIPAL